MNNQTLCQTALVGGVAIQLSSIGEANDLYKVSVGFSGDEESILVADFTPVLSEAEKAYDFLVELAGKDGGPEFIRMFEQPEAA